MLELPSSDRATVDKHHGQESTPPNLEPSLHSLLLALEKKQKAALAKAVTDQLD